MRLPVTLINPGRVDASMPVVLVRAPCGTVTGGLRL